VIGCGSLLSDGRARSWKQAPGGFSRVTALRAKLYRVLTEMGGERDALASNTRVLTAMTDWFATKLAGRRGGVKNWQRRPLPERERPIMVIIDEGRRLVVRQRKIGLESVCFFKVVKRTTNESRQAVGGR